MALCELAFARCRPVCQPLVAEGSGRNSGPALRHSGPARGMTEPHPEEEQQKSFLELFAAGAVAATIAEATTLPLDTAKVRTEQPERASQLSQAVLSSGPTESALQDLHVAQIERQP